MGFGGASVGLEPEAQDDEAAAALVDTAWSLGIRYFDTAPFYGFGLAERRLGATLKGRPRDDFVVSTKVGRRLHDGALGWPDDRSPEAWPFDYDYTRDGILRSFEGSLERIGLDRVDVLYVHDIDAKVHGSRAAALAHTESLMRDGGWRALDDLRASGAVKAIGVGVNEWEPCARMLELADPDLFLIAGRYTLLEQEPLNALFPSCLKRGVGVVIGGPLNAGVLAGGPLYDYAPAPAIVKARASAIAEVCARHGVSVLAAALQFAGAHPVVTSLLTGASNPAELTQNAQAFLGPAPPAELWAELRAEKLLHADAPTP